MTVFISEYTYNWAENMNEFIRVSKRIFKHHTKENIPDNFLGQWLITQFSVEKQAWNLNAAFNRCLEVLDIDPTNEEMLQKFKSHLGRFKSKITFNPADISPEGKAKEFRRTSNGVIYDTKSEFISCSPNKWLYCDLEYLYSMLKVYQTFTRYTPRGQQLALSDVILKEVAHQYKVCYEGFASPMNRCLAIYYSAFPAIDEHFGSHGSFFDTEIKRNIYINPPFVEEVLEKAFDNAEDSMSKNKINVLFIMPCWDDANAVIKAKASKYLKETRMISKNEKAFLYYNATDKTYNTGPCDCYLFILSSK